MLSLVATDSSNCKAVMTGAAVAAGGARRPYEKIRFDYDDMVIHMSRGALDKFCSALYHHPHESAIISVNVDVSSTETISFGSAAQCVLTRPSAGGSSIISEALSAEVVDRFLGIQRIKTEMELKYSKSGPITDFACTVQRNITLGISVTRAKPYKARKMTTKVASRLLTKKLKGILVSNQTVVNYTFKRQILHVWTEDGRTAATIKRICANLPAELRSNTIILISTVNLDTVFHAWI